MTSWNRNIFRDACPFWGSLLVSTPKIQWTGALMFSICICIKGLSKQSRCPWFETPSWIYIYISPYRSRFVVFYVYFSNIWVYTYFQESYPTWTETIMWLFQIPVKQRWIIWVTILGEVYTLIRRSLFSSNLVQSRLSHPTLFLYMTGNTKIRTSI